MCKAKEIDFGASVLALEPCISFTVSALVSIQMLSKRKTYISMNFSMERDFTCGVLLARLNSLTLRDSAKMSIQTLSSIQKYTSTNFFQHFSTVGYLPILSVRSPLQCNC